RTYIYDVSKSRLWFKGMHYEHWAGQDLTDELADAPIPPTFSRALRLLAYWHLPTGNRDQFSISNLLSSVNWEIRRAMRSLSSSSNRSVPNFSTQNEASAEPKITAFFML